MVFVSHSARAAGKKNLSAAVIVPPYIHSKGETIMMEERTVR